MLLLKGDLQAATGKPLDQFIASSAHRLCALASEPLLFFAARFAFASLSPRPLETSDTLTLGLRCSLITRGKCALDPVLH